MSMSLRDEKGHLRALTLDEREIEQARHIYLSLHTRTSDEYNCHLKDGTWAVQSQCLLQTQYRSMYVLLLGEHVLGSTASCSHDINIKPSWYPVIYIATALHRVWVSMKGIFKLPCLLDLIYERASESGGQTQNCVDSFFACIEDSLYWFGQMFGYNTHIAQAKEIARQIKMILF